MDMFFAVAGCKAIQKVSTIGYPRNLEEMTFKKLPKLKKSTLQLKQFDGTIIKTLGTFECMFETKNPFEIIPITLMACT